MKTNWKNFEIEGRFEGTKCARLDADSKGRHHIITVTNTDTGDKFEFDFWTSIARPRITDESDLFEAVECYLTEASFGVGSFEDYCSEMGYNVPKGIYESYKACCMANACVTNVFGEDWTDVADELREEM